MPLLELKNIKKSFDQNVILKDLSLTVEKGEVIVILGPSGCGKSTLLRCINGLETIQGGDILLDGEVISNRKKDMHLIRQKIGMVFQSYDLFPHRRLVKVKAVAAAARRLPWGPQMPPAMPMVRFLGREELYFRFGLITLILQYTRALGVVNPE